MTEDFKRKLTAILSADVEGYSRLMGEDEDSTVRTLTAYRKLMSSLIEKYHGHVVDSPGDNLLAEFESVRDAVLCAVEVQEELKVRNADLPDNRKMLFRIGINLGDIIKEEGRIYGDGVNVAARIESLSDAGGICLSRSAYDQVKKKLNYEYEHLGRYEVKNIDEPVSVYKVLMVSKSPDKVTEEKKNNGHTSLIRNIAIVFVLIIAGLIVWIFYPYQITKTEPTLNESEQDTVVHDAKEAPKTIAVLLFDNVSSDPEQDYFTYGLSEEILNSLCQIPSLGVTGKTSSFSFKGKDKTIREIADELGVDHILEGSVRKAGDTIRITAQLIRASDGLHLWSSTYDRELKDIFGIQEDIANRVADKLKLTLEAFQLLGGTESVDAYELYLQVKGKRKQGELLQASELLDESIKLDPEFALAWALKGAMQLVLSSISPADQVSSEFNTGLNAILKAIDLEPDLGEAYLALGGAYSKRHEFIEAEKACRKGMGLYNKLIDFESGITFHYGSVGYLRKNNELFEKMRQNDPLNLPLRSYYMFNLGLSGDIKRSEEEYEIGKTIFDQWILGKKLITMLRLGSRDLFPMNEIPDDLLGDPFWNILRENIGSPKKAIAQLRLIDNGKSNLNSHDFMGIAYLAAFFGDSELAMKFTEKAVDMSGSLVYIWAPVMKEARQLPRFKEYMREISLVDYWKEYGWPDLCRPVGDDDFECD